MGSKKDPAKFSIRFNAADPHQVEVIDLLNKQGRYKAQFITNAVRHYIRCSSNPNQLPQTSLTDEQIMRIVQNCLSKQPPAQQALSQEPPLARPAAPGGLLDDDDRDSIMQTLDMFK